MSKHFVKAIGIFTLNWILLTVIGLGFYLVFGEKDINDSVFILFPIIQYTSLILLLWLRYKKENARKPIRKSVTNSIAFIVSFIPGIISASFITSPYIATPVGLIIYLLIMMSILRLKDDYPSNTK